MNARAGVSYYYVVEGEYYAGEVAVEEFVRYGTVEAMKRRLTRGTKLRVRYRPGDPSVTVTFLQ